LDNNAINRNGEVWVFIEQVKGEIADVSLELLSKGRELADRLGVALGGMLLGSGVEPLAAKLIAHGADKVYVVDHELLARFETVAYTKAASEIIQRESPQIVIYGASTLGRDLAPRIASTLKSGLTADCTDLQIGDHDDAVAKKKHENLLLQIRPAFGGNIIATIVNPHGWPQMATVREGVMAMPEPDEARTGTVVKFTPELSAEDVVFELLSEIPAEKKVNLKAARVIVAGGGGVGSKENFKLVYELAHVLGGAVGASRAAVDNGYIDKAHQVGQTGTTVRPALYIALGVSGQVQHRAGMDDSAKIVAINNDPDAPIFSIAHYGIVADMNEVVPKMISAIRKRV
jgi:electron transfer flavoprotein alpha subunit